MMGAVVSFNRVSRIYPGGVRALDSLSFTIEAGEWVAVMGPSGSGKTTLLNLVDGLDHASQGRVSVIGADMGRLSADEAAVFRREHIGLVFQQFHLVPYLTVLENVMLAQYFHSLPDEGEAREALAAVNLAERAGHLPARLSGGEQQRACIARALVNAPEIVLADEPTGNLDEANAARVFEILRRLHDQGTTLVVVTHDPHLGALADRRILLQHGRLLEAA
jgi:putative ABC transport system ATP-binding protein